MIEKDAQHFHKVYIWMCGGTQCTASQLQGHVLFSKHDLQDLQHYLITGGTI